MRKPLLFFYIAALHVALGAAIVRPDLIERAAVRAHLREPRPIPLSHHDSTIRFYRWMDASVPDGAAIFLGDSITQGLATAAVAPHAVNYGIGGDTTADLLRALPEYQSLGRAGAIFVTIGVNDLLQGKHGIGDRLQQIANALPAHVPVIWTGIMPTNRRVTGHAEANAAIRAACEKRLGCTFIEPGFLADEGGIIPSLYEADGLHLSPLGYDAWIARLRESFMRASSAR